MAEQCQTAEVSRAGFYRYLHQAKPKQAEVAPVSRPFAGAGGCASSSTRRSAC